MAKKEELLEEILDEISIVKNHLISHDERLTSLETIAKELLKQRSVPTTTSTSPTQIDVKAVIPSDEIKNATYDGINNYYKDHPKSDELTKEELENIHNVFFNHYEGEHKKRWDKNKESELKQKKLIDAKRATQGILDISMVSDWAPEYSPEIQRVMRLMGLLTISEDESVESAHQLMKIWGDAFSVVSEQANRPPKLKEYLRPKWNTIKDCLHRRWGVTYCLIALFAVLGTFCLIRYQSMVMDLDRTNRIYYRYVIKNERRSEDYHELDSLIHSSPVFKTYRTLDE